MSGPLFQRQVHPLRNGMTTQQITDQDPTFRRLRAEGVEVSFRKLCPEVPSTTYLTHGIHPYPAKFIPQIPRYFIKTVTSPGDIILDPFAGSGTALVESTLLSRNSIGGDINPLSPLLWDVKTNFEDDITSWRFEFAEFFRQVRRAKTDEPPLVPSVGKWFDEGPIRDLGKVFSTIRDFPFTSDRMRKFLLVCASSTVRRVSRADPKVSKPFISRRQRERFALGPVDWRTLEVFSGQVEKYYLRLGAFYRAVKSETSRTGIDPRVTPLFPHDARKLPGLRNHSVDAAVTSPPYVSAQEYFRTVKLELFWLGLADERGVIELDKQVLGTEKVSKGSNPEFRELGVPSLDPGLVQIYRIDRARWLVAFEYFDGLRSHFSRMAQVLRPGAKYGFLIGDNTIRRVPLPVHVGIEQIAEEAGLRCTEKVFDRIVSRSLTPNRNTTAGLIDVEWFLTLEPN
jgi:DNA modification methylase